jgi:trehalose 6-phosphate synthase/phosphatase
MQFIADPSDPRRLATKFAAKSRLDILLEYDGTLVPYASTPSLAAPDGELIDLLDALTRRPQTRVEIVSGRDPSSLARWFGSLPLTLRGEHGAWTRRPGEGGLWTASAPVRARALADAADHLRRISRKFGGFIEYKQSGAVWHYRGVAVSEDEVDRVIEEARIALTRLGFDVLRGASAVEARPSGIHKGRAVLEALRTRPETTVVAIGNEATDEDMFGALPLGKEGVLVGMNRPTRAVHRLASHIEVRRLLAALAEVR